MVNETKHVALTPEESLPRWTSIATDVAVREVQTRCAVHTLSNQIVGFATAGTPRDDLAPTSAELWSLNVVPDHHGTGLASELMHEVLGEDVAAYLWVATGNGRAMSFYRKHGFELDGDTRFDPAWECHESRMTRA
ncbi:GNAT family N-acetyltransferase [Gordonia sp. PKS22-38]|uniref:GNAT family N-acetyltransferase n=1 Tax=Gordonia prachuapensis TaxID=3115651 RepID=A0ABU7MTZ3_9ACTN|nr:GNAT family N-acetyltransferase [Gordonia sp. PKS22-38]